MLLETYRVNVFEGNDSRIRKKKNTSYYSFSQIYFHLIYNEKVSTKILKIKSKKMLPLSLQQSIIILLLQS